MKIIELQITNVRGICDLLLVPDGKNCVVWGPNGCGKSAVVDAVDFLLTGQISRLMGKGTAGITLSKHGPHVGTTAEQAHVSAKLRVAGVEDPIEISRCMANPKTLTCEPKLLRYVEPVLKMAEHGQHVLTRRDILRYITAEAGTRAEQIQSLLNISDIEEIRRTFVKVENDFESSLKGARKAVELAEGQVNAAVQQTTYRPDAILETINRYRAVVGADAISDIDSGSVKAGVVPAVASTGKQSINLTLVGKYFSNLRRAVTEEMQTSLGDADQALRELVAAIRDDPTARRAVARQRLTSMGLGLIDEDGACPLCDTPWQPGELREYLEKRRFQEADAVAQHGRVVELAKIIAEPATSTSASIKQVVAVAELAGIVESARSISGWQEDLQRLSEALANPLTEYPCSSFSRSDVQRLLAPTDLINGLDRLEECIKSKYPETTPEQTAWDALTQLVENLKAVEKASGVKQAAELSYVRAKALRLEFEGARDQVLTELYNSIRNRFVDLYKDLHQADEAGFAAVMEPEGAGLKLEVDFHGHGTHPPHALHSEGHQDSMGLCLYLALQERLAGGLIDLIILDDVVMSVDADHRRELCRVLNKHFPRRQFLITTHDRTWASQLRSEGIVSTRESVEFYNWHLDTGPQVSYEMDLWKRITDDVEKRDIPAAAARLRRGSEDYFRAVCDRLRAPVIFKMSGQWELGELMQGAMSQYLRLLKNAKAAANSWNDKDGMEMYAELNSTATSIHARTQAEQWAVNANVHYNNWAQFSPQDFQPVLEAFHDLFLLFECSQCNTLLSVTTIGPEMQGVKCSCGKVSWNLVEKKKQQ